MSLRTPARAATRRTAWPAVTRLAGTAALAALAALAAGAPHTAAAQAVTVDEGGFTVSRRGAVVGHEDFRIVRQPGAAAFVARATGTYDDRRILPALQADNDGTPERYQMEVRRGSAVVQRVSAQTSGTHFHAQSQGESGEAAREFLLEPGTVVVDDEVYHQYYFVVRRAGAAGAATRVPVLAPGRGTQSALWVTRAGSERITIGAQTVSARHYTLSDHAAGRREVWTDDQGRVLRVVLAGEGIDVMRNDIAR